MTRPVVSTPGGGLAGAVRVGRELGSGGVLLVDLSGRGDKDLDTAVRWFGPSGLSGPSGQGGS